MGNIKKSYEKVRNIVSQMRNVDETIEQKIFVSIGNKENKEDKDIRQSDVELINFYDDYVCQENCELNKLKLRLRYSKALGSKFTEEQDEYNYVRSINFSLNIQSKKEYTDTGRNRIHCNFINSPEEYFKSKGVWDNWYDFIGVDTLKFIQSKEEWIKFCKGKNIESLTTYTNYCEEYHVLPKEPAEFYRDFTSIQNELGVKKKRR